MATGPACQRSPTRLSGSALRGEAAIAPSPAPPGARLPVWRALRPRGSGRGALGAQQRPRCSQAGSRVGVWSLQSAGPPPAVPFNCAPPRLYPDAPGRAAGGQRSVTRAGPPRGLGRRTGLPRGPEERERERGCWAGLWVGDAREALQGQDATLAFRSVGGAGLKPKAQGHRGAGRALARGAPDVGGPGLVLEGGQQGSPAGRPLAKNPSAIGRGPGSVGLPPAGGYASNPGPVGISVRGRLDTSPFYLDTAILFQCPPPPTHTHSHPVPAWFSPREQPGGTMGGVLYQLTTT